MPLYDISAASSSVIQKIYDFTIAGADQAAIDTAVDNGGTTAPFPTNGTMLEIFATLRTDDAAAFHDINLTFNNDTSSIYERQYMVAGNTTQVDGAEAANPNFAFHVHSANGSASYPGSVEIAVPNYAGTTFWKTGTAKVSSNDATTGNSKAGMYGFGYRSTSAITRVKIAGQSTAKLKVGSRVVIYIWT